MVAIIILLIIIIIVIIIILFLLIMARNLLLGKVLIKLGHYFFQLRSGDESVTTVSLAGGGALTTIMIRMTIIMRLIVFSSSPISVSIKHFEDIFDFLISLHPDMKMC